MYKFIAHDVILGMYAPYGVPIKITVRLYTCKSWELLKWFPWNFIVENAQKSVSQLKFH